jgi:lysophospholipase L1-like esterase
VSWLDLLVGHLEEHKCVKTKNFGISYTWDINYINLSTYSEPFADQVRNEVESISDTTGIMKELIFHPDGLHPNRKGHKILFDHIVKQLNL